MAPRAVERSAREGLPYYREAAGLTFEDVDLKRGSLTLNENKTDDPRACALDPGLEKLSSGAAVGAVMETGFRANACGRSDAPERSLSVGSCVFASPNP
jgi:hypothetical protein